MRVLRLKGRNLASLERFDIDLERAPLGNHGLFAITGATGSGKSTILDALCLALYNRTPRTEGRGGPVISGQDQEQGVRGTDPRLLMRRGAGEAFAEVEFLGHDQSRYRARWEVWRARRKPEGRLRDVRHTLARIDAKGDEIEVLNTHRRKDTVPPPGELAAFELRRQLFRQAPETAAHTPAPAPTARHHSSCTRARQQAATRWRWTSLRTRALGRSLPL